LPSSADATTADLPADIAGVVPDNRSTMRPDAPSPIDAIGTGYWFANWCLADNRSAIGASAARPIDAINASCGMGVVRDRECS
jgi:hypothetical protein